MSTVSSDNIPRSSPVLGQARRQRVLCLHGASGRSDVIKHQLSNVAIALEGEITFWFLDGPLKCMVPQDDVAEVFQGDLFDWYPFQRTAPAIIRAMLHVCNHIITHGPYDGILGFSQGANLCALLSVLAMARLLPEEVPIWSYAIFLCGIDPTYELSMLETYFRHDMHDINMADRLAVLGGPDHLRLDLPTLHVLGKRDSYLKMGQQLWMRCTGEGKEYSRSAAVRSSPVGPSTLLVHLAGHKVPMDKLFTQRLVTAFHTLVEAAAERKVCLDREANEATEIPKTGQVFASVPLFAPIFGHSPTK